MAPTAHRLPTLVCFIIALVICATFGPAFSFAAERDDPLRASGIRFPEGFDVNTIGEIRGKISALARPDTGPVNFRIESEYDTYTVFTAPTSYWREIGASARNGDKVIVKGSKTVGRDGGLYLVAQTVKSITNDEIYRFRDKKGQPLWMGKEAVEPAPKRSETPGGANGWTDDGGKSGGWDGWLDSIRGGKGKKNQR